MRSMRPRALFLGLIGAAIGLVQLDLSTQNQAWFVVMFLLAMHLRQVLWNQRAKLIALPNVGIVPRIESTATRLTWLL